MIDNVTEEQLNSLQEWQESKELLDHWVENNVNNWGNEIHHILYEKVKATQSKLRDNGLFDNKYEFRSFWKVVE